jgi:undecaprenyl-diphosphatase
VSWLRDALGGLGGPQAALIVGLLAAAEGAAFVGLVLPGELAMLLGGFLAWQGRVSLPMMMAAAAVGAVVGDSLGYEIGRRYGPSIRDSRLGRRIGELRWSRAQTYLADKGGRAVLLARFVGVLRALVPAVAGMIRMPYRTFLPWNVVGGLLWAPGFVLLGYVAGGSYQRVAAAAERVGLALLVLVALVAGIVAGARWLAANGDRVRAVAARQLERPRVAAVRKRYGTQLEFVARRLQPGGALGLSLTLGMTTLVGFGWTFGGILEDVLGREEVATLDSPVAAWLAGHRIEWLTAALRGVTELGAVRVVLPLLALVAAIATVRTRRLRTAGFLAAASLGTLLLVVLVKVLIGRARPEVGAVLAVYRDPAFPSGHSAQAVAAYGALAYLAALREGSWERRVWIGTAAALVALLVRFSRLYLVVNWLSDVLGGYTLGAAWLAMLVTATATAHRLRAELRGADCTPGGLGDFPIGQASHQTLGAALPPADLGHPAPSRRPNNLNEGGPWPGPTTHPPPLDRTGRARVRKGV